MNSVFILHPLKKEMLVENPLSKHGYEINLVSHSKRVSLMHCHCIHE